jgi:hypothetical protein
MAKSNYVFNKGVALRSDADSENIKMGSDLKS